MRFKYYLRGCGVGILIASLIFTIALHRRGGVMTDEKVMARASELGMVMDTQSEPATQLDATEVLQQMQTEKASETSQTQENSETETAAETENESEAGSEKESESESETTEVSFKVKSGEYCWTISENLEKAGLIDDAAAFRTYMKDNGYDDKVYTGTFTLEKGMTYKEIAKVLTKNP